MNIMIKRPVRSTIYALSVGTLITAFGSGVCADKMILDEAIDDYTAISNLNFSDYTSTSTAGYEVNFILEEAYNDYSETTTFVHSEAKESNAGLEKADIAAFELKQRPSKIPWVLEGID